MNSRQSGSVTGRCLFTIFKTYVNKYYEINIWKFWIRLGFIIFLLKKLVILSLDQTIKFYEKQIWQDEGVCEQLESHLIDVNSCTVRIMFCSNGQWIKNCLNELERRAILILLLYLLTSILK